jgi:hypothetical protein
VNLKICPHTGQPGRSKCNLCINDLRKKHRAADPETYRGYSRKWHRKKYGVNTGERRVGTCPLCDAEGVELRPDHNHETNKLRDWICARCNMALGFMEQNSNLRRLLAYLEKHK